MSGAQTVIKIHTAITNTREGQQWFGYRIKCPQLRKDWHVVNPKPRICKCSACERSVVLLCRMPEVTIYIQVSSEVLWEKENEKITTIPKFTISCVGGSVVTFLQELLHVRF